MISSMTGFGKSELIQDYKTITIEIRTLNSKTIDINSRLPYRYKEFDMLLRKKIADSLKRGKLIFQSYTNQIRKIQTQL